MTQHDNPCQAGAKKHNEHISCPWSFIIFSILILIAIFIIPHGQGKPCEQLVRFGFMSCKLFEVQQ